MVRLPPGTECAMSGALSDVEPAVRGDVEEAEVPEVDVRAGFAGKIAEVSLGQGEAWHHALLGVPEAADLLGDGGGGSTGRPPG